MDGKSLDIKQEKIDKLKELIPEAFTEADKIDVEKLRLTLGEDIELSNERYVLNWAGKSEAFKVLQTPTTATLAPDKDESVNFNTTENIFIEGENLEVLKVLQKSYYGKVKMIYIDPPYNTGNDSFIYPDKYSESKEEYLRRIGEKDEEGYLLKEGLFRKNSKENGQYHSNWLNMMYPRLFLARNLLKEDGVIFISIDDNEVHNLRLMMNEIFGEENFVASIIWQKKYAPQNDARWFTDLHDYIVLFAKDKDKWRPTLTGRDEKQNKYYKYDDKDGKGKWRTDNILVKSYTANRVFPIINPVTKKEYYPPKGRCWRYSQESIGTMIKENRIYFGKDGKGAPQVKRYLNEVKEGITPLTLWLREEVGDNQDAKNDLNSYFNFPTFDTPKPSTLIQKMISISTNHNTNDIILDFFAGSATTAQAVIESNVYDNGNRKFIQIQLEETLDETSEAYKADLKTISDIARERIKRVVMRIEDEKLRNPQLFEDKDLDLGFKVYKLKYSNFKLWRGDVIENGDDLTKQIDVFENPVREGTEEENILYELILKSGYELTTKIEKQDELFLIADNDLIIALNKIDESIIDKILQIKPKKCFALDKLFNGNDQLKTNTVLQMKDAGIEFKTI